MGEEFEPNTVVAADNFFLPLGAFGFEFVTFMLVCVFTVVMGSELKIVQFLHFLVTPIVVAAALMLDGIIISIESDRFGALAGLFCPRSGCDFDCEFECPGVCDDNIGDCTYANMRVLIFFFVFVRLISVVLNYLLWRDPSTQVLANRFCAGSTGA